MTKEDRREKDAAMAKRALNKRKKKVDDSEEQNVKPGNKHELKCVVDDQYDGR